MMTKEQLNERIAKKAADISKIERRISKWTSGMSEEAKSVAASMELTYEDPRRVDARSKYRAYSKEHENDPKAFRQDFEYNKGPNLEEAVRAYEDLEEAKATMAKYETAIAKMTNFENEEKIAVLWEFLQRWKEAAREWYRANCGYYFDLVRCYDGQYDKWVAKQRELYGDKAARWYLTQYAFEKEYFAGVSGVSKTITVFKKDYDENRKYVAVGYEVDESALGKLLDDEVHSKYANLVNQITAKAGEIKDVSNLSIGPKGDINGTVVGSKAKVRVQTFGAGGYNVGVIVNSRCGQVYHYRTRVDVVE